MTERDETELTAAQKRIEERVRALARADADPAFRERLMQQFTSGELREAPARAFAETAPGTAPAGPGRRVSPRVVPFPAWARWAALPAAAALAVTLVFLGNRGPAWSARAMSEQGAVNVAGVSHPIGQLQAWSRALVPGASVTAEDGAAFELSMGEFLVADVSPGTRMLAPTRPGRWWNRRAEFRVMQGEVQFLTGPGFAGGGLAVSTPEGIVELTGTVIAVNRDASGTCVCVMHGTAMVGTGPDDMEKVPSGMRKVMLTDGTPPFITEIMPDHQHEMLELEERHPHMR